MVQVMSSKMDEDMTPPSKITAKWLAYQTREEKVTGMRATFDPKQVLLTEIHEAPFASTQHMRAVGLWNDDHQVYEDEQSCIMHPNAGAKRIIVHNQEPSNMTLALEWKNVEVLDPKKMQILYAGNPNTPNPVDYELANGTVENNWTKEEEENERNKEQKMDQKKALQGQKARRVYMENDRPIQDWSYTMQIRKAHEHQAIRTNQIVRSPANDHTVITAHAPLITAEQMEKGEGIVVVGATNVTSIGSQKEYNKDDNGWEQGKKHKERTNPNTQELNEIVLNRKVAPRGYVDQTLRVLENGAYRIGLCHHGQGRIWQYVDTEELVKLPRDASEAIMHYVAVTIAETAPGAKQSGIQATILTEEGSKASGRLRESMTKEEVQRMRDGMAAEAVAARVHHSRGIGLQYQGVIAQHTCVAVLSDRQAQHVLRQIQKLQECSICEIMQAIIKRNSQPKSRRRKALEANVNETSEGRPSATNEGQGVAHEATESEDKGNQQAAENLPTRWSDLTIQDLHEYVGGIKADNKVTGPTFPEPTFSELPEKYQE